MSRIWWKLKLRWGKRRGRSYGGAGRERGSGIEGGWGFIGEEGGG